MNEINISKNLLEARHKKKITQEELARYIGVSKAAVSKWESGLSFPDISLLPSLAAFYNVSIDELIGYEPQMTKEQIKNKYHELKAFFSELPVKEAYIICEDLEKKYFSCFPFLLQLVVLYINHAMMFDDSGPVYEHCIELTDRIIEQSDSANDVKQASDLKVMCYLYLNEPMKALDMLDENIRPISPETELLANAYSGVGKVDKAKEAYQIAMYQYLISLISDTSNYLVLIRDNIIKLNEAIDRTGSIIDAYNVDNLHPNSAMIFYLTSAQLYSGNGQLEKAVDMIERYVNVCEKYLFPICLHGDEFFDCIDSWFLELDIGKQAPRSDEIIRESVYQGVTSYPGFKLLMDNPRYKNLINRLERLCDK